MTTATTTDTRIACTLPPRIHFAAACAGSKDIQATSDYTGARITASPDGTPRVVLDTTNGKIAARLAIHGSATPSASAIVPASLLKAAPMGKNKPMTTLTVSGSTCTRTQGDSTTTADAIDGTFPPIDSVYPNIARLAGGENHFVRVNPQLLAALVDAIGADEAVSLFIPKDNARPIAAVCAKNGLHQGIGLLMPLTSTRDDRAAAERVYEALTPNRTK